jgi:hypothetical protein
MARESPNLSSPTRTKRHKRIRWLPLLVGAAIVLVSGSVVADVVLTYVANTGVGANATSPFEWADGANYGTANGLGLATTAFSPSSTDAAQMSTTISGVQLVNVELVDVNTFQLAATLTSPTTAAFGTIGTFNVPTGAPGGVACAYAFITTYVPSTSGTLVPGAPAGCTAFIPGTGTTTSFGNGCTVVAAVTIDLVSGTVAGASNLVGACALSSSSATGTPSLYVSYAIYTTTGVTPSSLSSFGIPVTFT